MASEDEWKRSGALVRGLALLSLFSAERRVLTVTEAHELTGVPRPSVDRIFKELGFHGYLRKGPAGWYLLPKVLEVGMACVHSQNVWEIARPRMEDLVTRTRESTSMAQLDGSDITYVARVAVAKLVTLSVGIGTLFPAAATSMGKVLLAALSPAELDAVLAEPSRSGVVPRVVLDRERLDQDLRVVRARGWAAADEELALGIRSVAAGIRDGDGKVVAAVNVTVHAAETSMDDLVGRHLPPLLETAAGISADWALRDGVPMVTVRV